MEEQLRALALPFRPEQVQWRIGATSGQRGMALAYVDARDVMDRLDEAVGPANWSSSFQEVAGRVVCAIAVRCGEHSWVAKEDGSGDTDIEPEKGGLSAAFRRAAVHWGVGRYLYRLPSPWVRIEQSGRSRVIPPDELARLRAMLAGGEIPAQATKANTSRAALYRQIMERIEAQGATTEHLAAYVQARYGRAGSELTDAQLEDLAERVKTDVIAPSEEIDL